MVREFNLRSFFRFRPETGEGRVEEAARPAARAKRKERREDRLGPKKAVDPERCENKRANAEGQQRIEEEETLETRHPAPQLSCPFAAPSGPLMGQFRRLNPSR
jgi:hypothetical protein